MIHPLRLCHHRAQRADQVTHLVEVHADRTWLALSAEEDVRIVNVEVSFQDEFRALCRKYGVDLDERYVWE